MKPLRQSLLLSTSLADSTALPEGQRPLGLDSWGGGGGGGLVLWTASLFSGLGEGPQGVL